jgi:hypothetical protein
MKPLDTEANQDPLTTPPQPPMSTEMWLDDRLMSMQEEQDEWERSGGLDGSQAYLLRMRKRASR